jgi:hypothetical protein
MILSLQAHLTLSKTIQHKILAASILIAILSIPCCPLKSLYDEITFASLIRVLKQSMSQSIVENSSIQTGTNISKHLTGELWLPLLLTDLKIVIYNLPLTGTNNIMKSLIDALTSITASTVNYEICFACYEVITYILRRCDKNFKDLLVFVFQNLSGKIIIGLKTPTTKNYVEKIYKYGLNFIKSIARDIPQVNFYIIILVKLVCLKGFKNADLRIRVYSTISNLIPIIPDDQQHIVVEFFTKLSKTSVANFRILAIEVSCEIVMKTISFFDKNKFKVHVDRLDYSKFYVKKVMLCILLILQRCNDKTSQVRAKALQKLGVIISEFLLSKISGILAFDLILFLNFKIEKTLNSNIYRTTKTSIQMRDSLKIGSISLSNKIRSLLKMVRKRTNDEKGSVRQRSLPLLETLLSLTRLILPSLNITYPLSVSTGPTDEDISIVWNSCTDKLVSVRKTGLLTLSKLLESFPTEFKLASILVQCLLLLIKDVETTVREKALLLFTSVVIEPLKTKKLCLNKSEIVWRVLGAIGDLGLIKGSYFISKYFYFLKRNIINLAALTSITMVLINAITNSMLSKSMRLGVWIILAAVSENTKSIPIHFIKKHWISMISKSIIFRNSGLFSQIRSLSNLNQDSVFLWIKANHNFVFIIGQYATYFSKTETKLITETLLLSLLSFNLHIKSIKSYVIAVFKLSKSEKWEKIILNAAESVLSIYIENIQNHFFDRTKNFSSNTKSHQTFEKFTCIYVALFTIGELLLLPKNLPLSPRLKLLCQKLALGYSVYDKTSVMNTKILSVPIVVQAYAWPILGKIGLKDENIAKRLIPLLIKEVHKSQVSVVKNNILFTIADLYVRYTGLADTHIIEMNSFIYENCEIFRKNSLVLLARLLSADYLKCRTPVLNIIILALLDESIHVRLIAEHLIKETIKTHISKSTTLVEIILYLNNSENEFNILFDDKKITSTTTDEYKFKDRKKNTFLNVSRKSRRYIYYTLLNIFKSDDKGHIIVKLCELILLPIAEEDIPLKGNVINVILDTLWILASGYCSLPSSFKKCFFSKISRKIDRTKCKELII